MELGIRVLQIDLARQKETMDFVKKYIDIAKKYDYTHVLFYLENAVRTPDTEFFDKDGTYSLEEMREMVEYASSLGLESIPAFENLGHQEKFIEYPALAHFSETSDPDCVARDFGRNNGCPSNEEFLAFSDKYMTDVASVFPGEFIHVGLDEPWNFAVCPKCLERMAKGETKDDIFYSHIMHTYELCKKIGKRMMMWDDFFENSYVVDRLPRDIVMCTWSYQFIADVPYGHWTNRNKRDWFSLYDKMGFDYMFCIYANRTSGVYNLETFSRYASKHKPIGAIMTAWERADTFYEGAFPHIALTGRVWSGKITTEEEAINLYADIIGSRKIAEILIPLTQATVYANYDITSKSASDNLHKYSGRNSLKPLVTEIGAELPKLSGECYDIASDIYYVLLKAYLDHELNFISCSIHNDYECGRSIKKYLPRVLEIRGEFEKMKANADRLWAKNRPGIKSTSDKFEKKYANIFNGLDKSIKALEKDEKCGVITLEYMFPDVYATVNAEVIAKHEGREEESVYFGNLKHSENGGCFAYRVKTRNEKLEYIRFIVKGEGAMYPAYFRYAYDKNYFVTDRVEKVSGYSEHLEKILEDNNRFATLGYDNGRLHFNDVKASLEEHEIKIYFKEI